MLILALILAFFLIFLNVCCVLDYREVESPVRNSFIYSLLITAALVFIFTELLSIFNSLDQISIFIAWDFVTIAAFLNWLRWGKHIPKWNLNFSGKYQKIIFVSICFVLLITCVICFIAYPNTWDSMTFHLARVEHWLQNGNVKYYPSSVDRQVTRSPFAEYCMLHVYTLSGVDRSANFIQWIFMVGSLCVISLIAKEYGANKKMQLLSTFIAVTIPMTVLQSSSTQNDVVVSFFLLAAFLFYLKAKREKFKWNVCLFFFISAALALLVKATAYLFFFPVLLLLVLDLLRERKTSALPILIAGIFTFLFFNGLFFSRNYNTSHSFFGDDYGLKNDKYTFAGTISNASKNVVMQFGTPFPQVNTTLDRFMFAFHDLIQTDINDPSYNWKFSPAYKLNDTTTHEDGAGSPLHILFLIIAFFLILFSKERRKKYFVLWISLLFMFILFNLVLKWEVWSVRLQLPMLLFGSILIAAAVHGLPKILRYILSICLLLYALPFLFYNLSRPLIGGKSIFVNDRVQQYFMNYEEQQQPFTEMADLIKEENLKNIAWNVSGDSWEYPMWFLLNEEKDLRMEHILVENATKKYEDIEPFYSFVPQAIITNKNTFETDILMIKNNRYILIYKKENWKLFIQRNTSLSIAGECILPNPSTCNL